MGAIPGSRVEAAQGVTPPDLGQQAQLEAHGQMETGYWERFWAAYHASRARGHGYFVSVAAPLFNDTLALVIDVLSALQSKDNPEFYTLVSSVMSDLLGVPVDAETMRNAFMKGGELGGMQAVGAAFVKQLAGEFSAALDFDNDPRLKPAMIFLGFLLTFSVRIGNMTFITGLIPTGELIKPDDIREYGEQTALNLGLGRLARRALGPFIDDLVGKPMQNALRTQLRPTDLNANEAVRAFNRGSIDEAALKETLTKLGYADELHQVLVNNVLLGPNPDEAFALLRWGKIDQVEANDFLKRAGFHGDFIDVLQESRNVQRADTAVSDYLSALRAQVRDRRINSDTFRILVENLPITEEQKKWELRIAGQELEVPSRRLSLAQMRNFYFEGLIALDEFGDWTAAEGYGPDDQRLLLLDLLHDSAFEEDKIVLAEVTLKLRQLTIAKKAAKAGISLTQFRGL